MTKEQLTIMKIQKQNIWSDIFATAPGAWNPAATKLFFEAFTMPGGPQSMTFVSGDAPGSLAAMTSAVTYPLP
jgi:hypothetical protein